MFAFFMCYALLFGRVFSASLQADEYQCFSRFDYEYKVIQKLVMFEEKIAEIEKNLKSSPMWLNEGKEKLAKIEENLKTEVIRLNEKIEGAKTKTENGKQTGQDSVKGDSGQVYIRWGRTTCPGNGTDLVYSGFAAGSWYLDNGGTTSRLCLSFEPTWGDYDDEEDIYSAPLYGAEYQFDGRDRVKFFKKEVYNYDVPCAVCHTSRGSTVMIPGRNVCYPGWTVEYKGYLSAGRYDQKMANDIACMDDDPEIIDGTESNEDGLLFYFVEGRCGSLKCPPYVNGRELTCVVCSK